MDQSLSEQMVKQDAALAAASKTLAEARVALKQAEAGQGTLAVAQQALQAAQQNYLEVNRAYRAFLPDRLLLSKPLARAAYSDRMAWIMAKLARLAYTSFENGEVELESLKLQLQSGGFELVRPFNRDEMQAILVKNKDFAVLAFRGTQPSVRRDILADIEVYKKNTKDGRLHAGFVNAYNALALEVVDILTLRENSLLPLYITGHSLGGALATVATYRLEKIIGDRIAACYTFGGPRVGNGEFSETVKAAFYRIVHSTDIVTLVPTIGYSHIGDPRFITFSGNVYSGIPFIRRGLEILIALLPFYWGRWIACHSMDYYVAKLARFAEIRNPEK